MASIELSENELKLLIGILKEAREYRGDMGCNDPYDDEVKLFTKEERIEISKSIYDKEDVESMDGRLYNNHYVEHIINRIKGQTK